MKYPKILGSSVNPDKLSLTVKGLVPLIIVLLPLFGVIDISEKELLKTLDAILIAVTAGITAFGLIRKLVNKVK